MGVRSGTLHLILLPAVRKFGRTRFLGSFPPFILPPTSPPRLFLLFFGFFCCTPAWPPPPPPLPPSVSHFCIRSALSHYRSEDEFLSQCWSPAIRGGRHSVKIIHTCMHAYIPYVHAHMFVCMYVRTYACMHVCVCVCKCLCVCMYIYTHIHAVYIYIYVYMYTHMGYPRPSPPSPSPPRTASKKRNLGFNTSGLMGIERFASRSYHASLYSSTTQPRRGTK